MKKRIYKKVLIFVAAGAALAATAFYSASAISCLLSPSLMFVQDEAVFVFSSLNTMPKAPTISDIHHSFSALGMTVHASIAAQRQQKLCCGIDCDRADCEMDQWYLRDDYWVSPNPPCIPNPNGQGVCHSENNPKLFYYLDEKPSSAQSVVMSFNSEIGKFDAVIPLDSIPSGASITYYIAAADSAGNVTSMLPVPDIAPSRNLREWFTVLETAPMDNCAAMNRHNKCSQNINGAPICGTSFTVNDPAGDTCGEPELNGQQAVIANKPWLDIIGLSAGAGKGYDALPNDDVLSARVGLGAMPPSSGSGAVETYSLLVSNPDIPLPPNPADAQFANMFAVTYTPKMAAVCANLNNYVWDVDCMTAPNPNDPYSCDLIRRSNSSRDLAIDYIDGAIRFIVKDRLPNGKTLIGQNSKSASLVFISGMLQLSGGLPFWVTDSSSALTIVKKNRHVADYWDATPRPPVAKSSLCKINGIGWSDVCMPAGQPLTDGAVCELEAFPSGDKDIVAHYNVYVSDVDDPHTATLVPELSGATNFPENNSPVYKKTYNIPFGELDGKTRHFYFSAVGDVFGALKETPPKYRSALRCSPPYVSAPPPPRNFTCSAPPGHESACHCRWERDASVGDSFAGYDIQRDGVKLNLNPFTINRRADEGLTNGVAVSYQVRMIDASGAASNWASASCVPQDLKPPGKVQPNVFLQPARFGVNIGWQLRPEPDMAGGGGYNIYYCEKSSPDDCGADSDGAPVGFSKLNYSLVPQPAVTSNMSYSNDSAFGSVAKEWCFIVEACDNCRAAGTCPDSETANCSEFDDSPVYRKCLIVTDAVSDVAPLWPQNPSAYAPPEGEGCSLSWGRVCADEAGPFADCEAPASSELSAYFVMRAPGEGGVCDGVSVPGPDVSSPAGIVSSASNPTFTDSSGVSNGDTYCYSVYAMNSEGAFSRAAPVPAPVACVPCDSVPPAMPRFAASLSSETVSWLPANDKNALVYDVYKCEGGWSACDSQQKFSLLATGVDGTSVVVGAAAGGENIIYCVAAVDPSGNSSPVFNPTDTRNCGYIPAASNACLPPTSVEATEIPPRFHWAKVGWANSLSDAGGGQGYNIRLCSGPSPSTCADNAYFGKLTPSPIPGAHNRLLGQEPFFIPYINAQHEADYYIGVSYVGGTDCVGESSIAVSSNPARIMPSDFCSIYPDNCEFGFSIVGAIGAYGIIRCDSSDPECLTGAFKKSFIPSTQATIEVFSDADGETIFSRIAGDGLSFKLRSGVCSECAKPGVKYGVRTRIPAGQWNPASAALLGCPNAVPGGDCVVVLRPATNLSSGSISFDAVSFPDASLGAGGGDVGNPTCRPTVHVANLQPLKYRFGANVGDEKYHPAVDFNMDGKISIHDLAILKMNFGKTVPVSANTLLCDPLFDAR